LNERFEQYINGKQENIHFLASFGQIISFIKQQCQKIAEAELAGNLNSNVFSAKPSKSGAWFNFSSDHF
jgi:hypothetical protein